MKKLLTITFALLLANLSMAQQSNEPDTYNYNRAKEAAYNENLPEAMDYFQKELKENPKNGYAHTWVAAIYVIEESYGDALTSINKAIKYLPSKDKYWTAVAYQQRAEIYLHIGDTTLALKDFATAVKTCDDDEKMESILTDRAQLYYEMDEYELSNKDYEEIVKINEGGVMGHMGQARNLIATKQYDKAIEKLNHVVLLHSDYSSGYSFRAEAYMGAHRYNEAADDIIKALDIDDDNKAFYLMQIMADSAFTVMNSKLRSIAAKNPQQLSWQYYLGIFNEARKNYDQAITYYKKCFDNEPHETLSNVLGRCYESKGDFQQAIFYYKKGLELDSTAYRPLKNLADVEYSAGLYDESIADYTKLIDQYPDYAHLYVSRAWVKDYGKGDTQGAIEDYTTALTLAPDMPYAYMQRGSLYRLQGKETTASHDFQQAIELDTKEWPYACAHFCYLFLGQRDSAIAITDRLLKHDRTENLYNAACIYSIMGDTKQAIDYLRESLDSGYNNIIHIQRDRDLNNLRSLPEYKALIDKYTPQQTTSEATPASTTTPLRTTTTEVPFTRGAGGGVCRLQCTINGLPLNMIFDTGADDISISSVEAAFMFKNGYLSKKDVIGRSNYMTAGGEVHEGTIINLANIEIGGLVLTNVRASVVKNQNAPILLGQSVLSRLGKIEIDNNRRVLKITHEE